MLEEAAVRGVVVDDQHPGCRPDCAAVAPVTVGARCFSKSAVNQKVEPWPGVLSTPICAAHQLDQLLGDRQSQSGAAVLARGRAIGLNEGAEQSSLRLRGDADAGVLDLEAQRRVRRGLA